MSIGNAKTTTSLYGHQDAEAQLLSDFAAGTLAHGWIIAGPRGIGKATLAYRFARALLSSPSPGRGEGRGGGWYSIPNPAAAPTLTLPPTGRGDNPTFRRIAAGSHADLLVVEPPYDPKKEETAREIPVAQARKIAQFLSLTPGESNWRVVIVDSADALNHNGANAILKILEEPPPQALLLLLSHNPGRLLPTIRSRCRMLKLKPLDAEAFAAVMRENAPDLPLADLETLSLLADGSPGVALELHAQGALELYAQLLAIMSGLPQPDHAKIHALAERIGSGSVHANWQIFSRLTLNLLARLAKLSAGQGYDSELTQLAPLHPPAVWAAKWQDAADQFSLAERLHLDYKQLVITFMHSLATPEEARRQG